MGVYRVVVSRAGRGAAAAVVVACVTACLSAEHPSREGEGLPSDGPPPRACPPAPDPATPGELCQFQVRCAGGRLYGEYGQSCARINECCELGCRQDMSTPRLGAGGNDSRPSERAHMLCEEYRLLRGARRPGDDCGDEFDCLPYPESTTAEGEAWPHLMACVDGKCREQAASIPADYDAPCTPDIDVDTTVFVGSGLVTRGSCANGQCSIIDPSGLARCTMQCERDADCPVGSSCRAQPIGAIVNLYDHGVGSFCAPTCREAGSCDAMSE